MYVGMQQEQTTPPLRKLQKTLRFNETAGSDSDSGFLSESWRGCEEKATHESNLQMTRGLQTLKFPQNIQN